MFGAVALMTASLASASLSSTRVRLTSTNPLAVAGSGFAAGEAITVLVTVGVKTTRGTTRSDSSGAWRLRFPTWSVGRCKSFSIVAVGSTNDRARLALAPSCGPVSP
jgi:opacity protein-like surface antigen